MSRLQSRWSGALASLLTLSTAVLAPLVACGGDDEAGSGSSSPSGGTDAGTGSESAPPKEVPTGAISFPKVDVWTPAAKGRVVGTAKPPPSRTVVQVAVNGKTATSTDGYATWSVDVDLVRGANPLILRIVDSAGETTTTTGVSIESNVPMRNNIATDAIVVKEGIVYAGDVDEVVSFPAGGGPRTSLAKIDGQSIHHLAIDGSTIYVVTRTGKFGSVPIGGGTFTSIGDVLTNRRAMAVAGGKLLLLTRFAAFGTNTPSGLDSHPLTGGEYTPIALTYPTPLNVGILDYDVVGGAFYVTVDNHKPLVVPLDGGAVTDLDISRNTGAGDEYPKLIKVANGKIYVSFDITGKSWFTTSLTGGALTPSSLVLPAEASPWTDYVIDGDACFFPSYLGGIERAPLTGGPSKFLSNNDIVDHALFGTADASDFFLTTPKGVTAFSRTKLEKRELYTWPAINYEDGYRTVAATAGDSLYVAQGDKVTVITKSTGEGKVFVPDLKVDGVAKAIVADDKTVYVRAGNNGEFELYDAATGAYAKTVFFAKPHMRYHDALAADATSLYTVRDDALVKMPKTDVFGAFDFAPFGTPAVGLPTSMVVGGDSLWVLDDQRKLSRIVLATGTSSQVVDGTPLGFAGPGMQHLVAIDDDGTIVSVNGLFSRVMVTDPKAGASYYLR